MAVLNTLKLTSEKREITRDPIIQRRQRLIDQLEDQKALVEGLINDEAVTLTRQVWEKDEETGQRKKVQKIKRIRNWFWHNLAGTWFFEVRYANRVLELGKGKNTIEVASKEMLPEVIETVMAAVRAGELDEEIKKAGAKNAK